MCYKIMENISSQIDHHMILNAYNCDIKHINIVDNVDGINKAYYFEIMPTQVHFSQAQRVAMLCTQPHTI